MPARISSTIEVHFKGTVDQGKEDLHWIDFFPLAKERIYSCHELATTDRWKRPAED
jgi:hypothetical protein